MDPNTPSSGSVQNTAYATVSDPNLNPTRKRVFSKKLLIIGVLILTIIIAVVIFLFMPKADLQKSGVTQPKIDTFPYAIVDSQGVENADVIKEMAKEISDYVLSQRRNDGYYNYLAHYDNQCVTENGEKRCPFNGVNMFETTNSWTALALFSASQILGDQTLLQEAKKDLKKLEEYCMLDKTQCNWVLAQPAIIYQTTKDPELLEFLKVQGETLLASSPSEDAMLVAIEARQLALLFEIFQDTRYIVAAQNRLLTASRLLNGERDLYPSNNLIFAESSCWVSLANAQLSRSTVDEQEKNNTTVFLQNGRVLENFENFYQPITIQPCIESYALIGDLSQTKNILMEFIEKFYDGSKNKLVYGEGGTIFEPDTQSKNVGLTDSAYTLYLLNQL